MHIKTIFILVLSFVCSSVLGQVQKSLPGEYILEKATFTVYNAQQNSLIKTYPVTEEDQYEGWMYYNNLFTRVVYQNEKLSECSLLNGQKYSITDQNQLELIKDISIPDFMSSESNSLSDQGRLSYYTIHSEKGKLIIESIFSFSLPNVTYSCRGVLKLVMTQQDQTQNRNK